MSEEAAKVDFLPGLANQKQKETKNTWNQRSVKIEWWNNDMNRGCCRCIHFCSNFDYPNMTRQMVCYAEPSEKPSLGAVWKRAGTFKNTEVLGWAISDFVSSSDEAVAMAASKLTTSGAAIVAFNQAPFRCTRGRWSVRGLAGRSKGRELKIGKIDCCVVPSCDFQKSCIQ